MSTEGLPNLEDLISENFSDMEGDVGDAPLVSESEVSTDEVEQSVEDSDVPAKLSDLFRENLEKAEEDTQSDDSGQAESGPIDLDTEIEIDGQRITVRELARQRDEMRKDYTQKTQTLSEERQQFEAERDELLAAKDIRDLIKENPVGTIAEMALRAGIISQETYNQAVTSGRKVDPSGLMPEGKKGDDLERKIQEEVDRRLQEALENDPARQEYAIRELQARVSNTFAAIEKDHGVELDDDDRRVVMQKAVEMGEGNLEYVFLKLNQQLQQQQQAKQRVKDGAPKRSVRGPQPGDEDTTRPEKFDSVRDAWRYVEASLGA